MKHWIAWVLALVPTFAFAQASTLIVQDAWMRKPPGSDTAAVYFKLRNTGAEPVIVIGASSPVAGHVMIHETSTAGGQARMRMHERLVIGPGQTVSFAPGGMHVMLSDMKKAPMLGQKIPLVLFLAGGGSVQVAVLVKPLGTP